MNEEEIAAVSGMELPDAEPPVSLKKAVSYVFKWLLLYNLLAMILGVLTAYLRLPSGMESNLSILLSVAILFLATRKKMPLRPFEQRRKMSGKDFLYFLCLLTIAQFISYAIMYLVESTGVKGTSISISLDTLPMILYVGFIGPFAEEMVYRCFTVGSLEKYGKRFAILLSSLAFGLMHMNASQFIAGLITGMLLSYVFLEYSIVYSILLHIFNNFVLVTLPVLLFPNMPEEKLTILILVPMALLSVTGIVMFIRRRDAFTAYVTDETNRASRGSAKAALSSPWFIIYCLIYLGGIILMMVFASSMENIVAQAFT